MYSASLGPLQSPFLVHASVHMKEGALGCLGVMGGGALRTAAGPLPRRGSWLRPRPKALRRTLSCKLPAARRFNGGWDLVLFFSIWIGALGTEPRVQCAGLGLGDLRPIHRVAMERDLADETGVVPERYQAWRIKELLQGTESGVVTEKAMGPELAVGVPIAPPSPPVAWGLYLFQNLQGVLVDTITEPKNPKAAFSDAMPRIATGPSVSFGPLRALLPAAMSLQPLPPPFVRGGIFRGSMCGDELTVYGN